VKRALYLLALPAAAAVVAVFSRTPAPPPAPAGAPPVVAPSRASTRTSTWVTTAPGHTTRAEERAAKAPHQAGPKPPTDSRTALMDSHVPALAVASLNQADSPRQRLLSGYRGPSEARLAQVERLSERSETALARLKAARAEAQGEERARIDRAIAAIGRNQSFRTRIVAGRTPPTRARPGTGEGPVPQYDKR
jgi:hypothetical protein